MLKYNRYNIINIKLFNNSKVKYTMYIYKAFFEPALFYFF